MNEQHNGEYTKTSQNWGSYSHFQKVDSGSGDILHLYNINNLKWLLDSND